MKCKSGPCCSIWLTGLYKREMAVTWNPVVNTSQLSFGITNYLTPFSWFICNAGQTPRCVLQPCHSPQHIFSVHIGAAWPCSLACWRQMPSQTQTSRPCPGCVALSLLSLEGFPRKFSCLLYCWNSGELSLSTEAAVLCRHERTVWIKAHQLSLFIYPYVCLWLL